VPTEWFTNIHLVDGLSPLGKELNCLAEGDDALRRVRRYLARTAPTVLRRVDFDADCDPQLIAARRRSDLVVVLRAVAHLAAA
jgi:hypothetical protein